VARGVEIGIVYGGGLAQGLALVSFPAAATILTAAGGYGLSSSQYGSIFLPLFVGAVLASLLAPALARRRGLRTVLVAGFGANGLSMATFAASAAATGVLQTRTAIEKVSFAAEGTTFDFNSLLPSLNTGKFLVRSENVHALIQGNRSLVETRQLGQDEVLAACRR
jgi:MFS family permease